MNWALERSRELLRTAESRLAEGKPRQATATLVRAFDVLEVDDGPGGDEGRDLRVRILEKLEGSAERAELVKPILPRAARCFPQYLEGAARSARALVRRLALEEGEEGPEALEIYVSYLENGGPRDRELKSRLTEILAQALHVRMDSSPERIAEALPLLERLHGCRPRLAFPRLYLARIWYLEGRAEEAAALLEGIGGALAETRKVLNFRARCAERLGRKEEARQLLVRSLELRETQPQVHLKLGRGLLEDALEAAARAQAAPEPADPGLGQPAAAGESS